MSSEINGSSDFRTCTGPGNSQTKGHDDSASEMHDDNDESATNSDSNDRNTNCNSENNNENNYDIIIVMMMAMTIIITIIIIVSVVKWRGNMIILSCSYNHTDNYDDTNNDDHDHTIVLVVKWKGNIWQFLMCFCP